MHAFGGRHQAVREAHAPGKRSGRTVVTVAGDQAADTANAIAEGRGGRGYIEHQQDLHAVVAGEQNQRGKSTKQSAKPRKTSRAEKQRQGISEKFRGTFQQMVETRTRKAGEAGDADDAFRVHLEGAAAEVGAHDEKRADQARRDHQAVGAERYGTEMYERMHANSADSRARGQARSVRSAGSRARGEERSFRSADSTAPVQARSFRTMPRASLRHPCGHLTCGAWRSKAR